MKDFDKALRKIIEETTTDVLEWKKKHKKTEYILGERGGLLDDEGINEAVIIGYNTEGGTR